MEWPDGRREALLFVFEEETDPCRFSIHRLAHYCLDLSKLIGTERVVPVVIFLHRGGYPEELHLGGDAHCYLHFRYLAWPLFRLRARDYFDSPNLVARLNLPNMAYAPEDKLEVYAQAVRGLLTLEPDPERRIKYLDFVDIYADLDQNERKLYQERYSHEANLMNQFAERFVQQGEAQVLLRLLSVRFGELPPEIQEKIESADADTLLHWSERVLSAQTLDEVVH